MPIKRGDIVAFKPEWSVPRDEKIVFRAIEDEGGRRSKVVAEIGLPLNLTQVVKLEWIATVNGQRWTSKHDHDLSSTRRERAAHRVYQVAWPSTTLGCLVNCNE
jgi:hypothetical protein